MSVRYFAGRLVVIDRIGFDGDCFQLLQLIRYDAIQLDLIQDAKTGKVKIECNCTCTCTPDMIS